MPDAFDRLIGATLGLEGGYVDNPADKGGPTNWGVTQALARQYGYAGDMRAMTRDQASAILRQEFWTGPHLDQLAIVSERVAGKLLDTGINMGMAQPVTWLQRGLNVLNRRGADYADLPVTGHVGPLTLQALQGLVKARGLVRAERVLLIILQGFQTVYFVELGERLPADETFEDGWLENRVGVA